MTGALGMIEVEGVAGLVVGTDAGCKAAAVELMGWESIGGFTTAFLRGSVDDVTTALRHAETAVREVVEHVVTASLDRPQPACAEFAGIRMPDGEVPETALGMIETRGYGAHVPTNDAMVKEADVAVARVLTIHNRVVCSLVTGSVDAVEQAIVCGRERLRRSEWFLASAVIPQPLSEVLRAFTLAGPGPGAS